MSLLLNRLRENRLKLVSVLCILGDTLMGLGGAVGLFRAGSNTPDILLATAGAVGLLGHFFIILWGKGGKPAAQAGAKAKGKSHALRRALLPHLYPLDSAFWLWGVSSLAILGAGASSGNLMLALAGVLCAVASLFGWLWPQERHFFGLRSVQVSSLMYMTSGVSNVLAGLWAHNAYISAAGLCYMSANMIFYTVRKEDQSKHTISEQLAP